MRKTYTASPPGSSLKRHRGGEIFRNIVNGAASAAKWSAALGVIAASSAANGLFAWQMSQGAPMALAVAATAGLVAIDWLKPLAPLAAATARNRGARAKMLLLMAAWALALVTSLAAAIGVTALVRSETHAARQAALEARQAVRAQIRRLEAELAQLPAPELPIAALEAKIAAVLQDPRAEGCAKINGPYTRKYCPRVRRWQEQAAIAKRRRQLAQQLAAARGKLAAMPPAAAADPQAERIAFALSALPGKKWTAEDVQNILPLLMALALELYAAIALVLATGTGSPPARRRKPAKRTQPASDEARLNWLRARREWRRGQRALAEAWGLSLGKTNRLLKSWEAQGLVRLARGSITAL